VPFVLVSTKIASESWIHPAISAAGKLEISQANISFVKNTTWIWTLVTASSESAADVRTHETASVITVSHTLLHKIWSTFSECLMGLLQLRFELDSATTRYNTLRGFSCARIRHGFEHSTRISGRRVLHVDWQLNAHNFYFILIAYPTSCVWIRQKLFIQTQLNANMPSIQLFTVKL